MKVVVFLDRRKDKYFEEGDDPFSILMFDANEHLMMIFDVPKDMKKELRSLSNDEILWTIPDAMTEEDRNAFNKWWESRPESDNLKIFGVEEE